VHTVSVVFHFEHVAVFMLSVTRGTGAQRTVGSSVSNSLQKILLQVTALVPDGTWGPWTVHCNSIYLRKCVTGTIRIAELHLFGCMQFIRSEIGVG
jgi:hypothetical protein